MSRIGISPTRGSVGTYQPSRLNVGILVRIPRWDRDGRRKLSVLQACLKSIKNDRVEPIDVYTCEVETHPDASSALDHLQAEGWIDFRIRTNEQAALDDALRILAGGMLGESLVLCHGTFAFQPGWVDVLAALNHEAMDQIVSLHIEDDRANEKASLSFDPDSIWLMSRAMAETLRKTRALDSLPRADVVAREFIAAVPEASIKPGTFEVFDPHHDQPRSLLERVYDDLFWFLTDARKTWLEIEED